MASRSTSLQSNRLLHAELASSAERISLVIPVYNEGETLSSNLMAMWPFIDRLTLEKIKFEIVIVDDGSTDSTSDIVDRFAREDSRIRVFHHKRNFGLGKALETGFVRASGDYIITIDSDLTYSLEHVSLLITEAKRTGAHVVVTSPYMHGGTARFVPADRLLLSRAANLILKLFTRGRLSTFTCMVRLYRREFLDTVSLSALGPEVNLEILHHAFRAGAIVKEIPGHLNWESRRYQSRGRLKMTKLWRQICQVLYYGRLIRQVV